ncbi:KilA-N domain-containing protein [Gardnerella vaginalis]|uniref:KilA-N domain-containing protein n=1 Tax=Gardnerella TaxID=2701 RepID=UPI000263487B|nr:KilA-N domain-containing protein [Gardnerella vaginalis]EIK76731.1 KilA domain protein [Gardnerella vaginalis 0288E]PKZ56554.1 DNA-binding protein [Gardnerella vaginalis]PKZ73712.1 DNA-binding protein [Gardnerella vaginalis]
MSNASNIKKDIIKAKGFTIQVYTEDFRNDYVSLTDIARYKNKEEPNVVVANWMRNYSTIEYLGIWERLNNPNFKPVEFEGFLKEAGSNAFTLSPKKWSEITNAIGLLVKSGRGGGTYAHKDIAFKFAAWISAEFELYIIKDYQRLKSDENSRLSLNWNLNREISKINYKIHTDAIKEYLLKDLTPEQLMYKYANEADLLNVALFNKTAKQWRDANPKSKGNIRDEASINELLVLANMESYNAVLISKGLPQADRMVELRNLARTQILSLENLNNSGIKSLDSALKN